MSDDAELDYAWLTQDALRGVVRSVLETTVALGMPPGEHHFYVEFATNAPGVQIPGHLRAQYPERMTIVLQHQFEGLEVDQEGFAVTLHFSNVPARLVVPFAAITQFADPSANFMLQFAEAMQGEGEREDGPGDGDEQGAAPLRLPRGADRSGDDDDPPTDEPPASPPGGADVVSLDRFRRK